MAAYLELEDFDSTFEMLDPNSILLVNELDSKVALDRQRLIEQLVTRYEGDSLTVVPSCECGHSSGAHRLGKIAPCCGTLIQQTTERAIESSVWMKVPDGVKGFIHPTVYHHFSKFFNSHGINVVDWLCRKSGVRGDDSNPAIIKLKELGFKRGLNNFIDQFDMFIEHGFQSRICGGGNKKKAVRMEFREWVIANRDKIFCEYLPFPSRISFVVEEEESQAIVDKNVKECINAAMSILSIGLRSPSGDARGSKAREAEQRQREDRALMACTQLSGFYEDFFRENIGGKPGWLRKHVFGSRLNFTFRGVITSIHGPHHYQDLHLPWSIAVNVFGLHISNKLLRRGFTPRQISRMIMEYTNVYHPLLHEIMMEIIEGHPDGKFPLIFQRNPSLSRLSAQLLYVTKIETDPTIRSIALSLLILRGFNADFDGDELNGLLITDMWLYRKMKLLSPHFGLFDLHNPRAISKNVGLPTPVVSTMAHWFNEPLKKAVVK